MKPRLSRSAILLLAVFVFLMHGGGEAMSAESAAVELVTPSGPIAGLMNDGIEIYKGIPFAKPPVGELRFAPPKDVVPWSETLDCTEYGDIAVQRNAPYGLSMSEDCLTLNVWTPARGNGAESLPVYVFIHGGGMRRVAGRTRCMTERASPVTALPP